MCGLVGYCSSRIFGCSNTSTCWRQLSSSFSFMVVFDYAERKKEKKRKKSHQNKRKANQWHKNPLVLLQHARWRMHSWGLRTTTHKTHSKKKTKKNETCKLAMFSLSVYGNTAWHTFIDIYVHQIYEISISLRHPAHAMLFTRTRVRTETLPQTNVIPSET